jgi:hypothetical protein
LKLPAPQNEHWTIAQGAGVSVAVAVGDGVSVGVIVGVNVLVAKGEGVIVGVMDGVGVGVRVTTGNISVGMFLSSRSRRIHPPSNSCNVVSF